MILETSPTKQRSYLYYDSTISLCSVCLKRVDAKIIFENEKVFLVKRCPDHGRQQVMIADDIEYYKKSRQYMKKSEMPRRFNTRVNHGCPNDCGLCEDHEQHSCLSLIEITDHCDLNCPTCYASSHSNLAHRDLQTITSMFDTVIANEGVADVVQISGGEPTTHPELFTILDMAKARPIRHLMLNTNGIKIAEEEGFAEQLAAYMPAFEIYLQFDSLNAQTLKTLRGKNLLELRKKAIEKLNALNLSTTLVVTLQRGLNDLEIGELIDFAVAQKCVRGITFQPIQNAGRVPGVHGKNNLQNEKLSLTEIRNKIIKQSNIFTPEDLVPVPCHPDSLCMGYAIKNGDQNGEQITPLTRFIDPAILLEGAGNTISFERDEGMKNELQKKAFQIFSTGCSPTDSADRIHDLLCCLPKVEAPGLTYNNIFRILIMRFMDADDFDLRSIRKSCVHIAHPDGRMIPFDTMNLFYRGKR